MAEHQPIQGALDFEAAIRSLRTDAARAFTAAQQLASIGDLLAREAFEDAERVSDRAADAELQVKVREAFASFLKDHGHLRLAKERLVKAGQIAQAHGFDEDVARIEVRTKEIEAELLQDAGLKACLANFEDVAEKSGCSWQDKRDVLFAFIADLNRSGGRIAARGIGSKDDFKDRLDKMKWGHGQD